MYIEPPVCRTRRTGGHSKIHSAGDADQEYIHMLYGIKYFSPNTIYLLLYN